MVFGKMKTGIIPVVMVLLAVSSIADTSITEVTVINSEPTIDSVITFRDYVNDSVNNRTTFFSVYNNTRNVFVQVKVSDLNGYRDLDSVKVRVVFLNGSTESNFPSFGTSYVDANFESGTLTQAIYYCNFTMGPYDPTRLGIENPPLYYRVKAQVSDGTSTVTSDTSSSENEDYTYEGYLPSFDIEVNIQSGYGVAEPGDEVVAGINITKFAPPGAKNINITYELINPLDVVVDSLTESTSVTNSINATRNLTVPVGSPDGPYKFRVTVSYPEGLTSSEAGLSVVYPEEEEEEEEEEEPTRPISGYVMPPESVPFRQKGPFDVIVPESFSIYPQEERLLSIIIANDGQIDILDVNISLTGIIIPSKITPESVEVLAAGDKTLFIATIKAPGNLAIGKYTMILKVFSEGVKIKEERIGMEVLYLEGMQLEITGEELLRSELFNLRSTHDQLWGFGMEKGSMGLEVSGAVSLMNEAESYLAGAESSLDEGDLLQARRYLERAKSLIEKATLELSQLKVVEPRTQYELILVIILLAFISIVLYINKRKVSGSLHKLMDLKELEVLNTQILRSKKRH
ncbi:MAG: hypothetical protein JXB14_06385 [Candidatus Altiarchaeota archaeon]|nr:hypothetical protein [Candidatus Altiarchaeota archaeon]